MAEELPSSLGMLQAGFDRIDTALAANDAASAAMLDEYLIGVSRAYGKRVGINPNALRAMAKKMIQSRIAAVAQQESAARETKLQSLSVAGAAERKFNLGMEGLRINQEQFDRNMFRQYVGAAVSAAGATIAEGVRNGLFEFDFDFGDPKKGDKAFEGEELDDPGDNPELQGLKTLSTDVAGGTQFTLDEPGLRSDESTRSSLDQLGQGLATSPDLLRTMQRLPQQGYEQPPGMPTSGQFGQDTPQNPVIVGRNPSSLGTRGPDSTLKTLGTKEGFAPRYEPPELLRLKERRRKKFF
tara:strand:+ start:1249 stop:2139 length:891 start_codon:yes stop_codon:yes gene_type:complete